MAAKGCTEGRLKKMQQLMEGTRQLKENEQGFVIGPLVKTCPNGWAALFADSPVFSLLKLIKLTNINKTLIIAHY